MTLAPDKVFTPRSPHLNADMYVDRPDLERQLRNAIGGQKHIILYGDSGNGKTWLYNRVFQSNNAFFTVLNLASANLHGDLLPVISEKIGEFGIEFKSEVRTEVKSGIMPQNIGVQVTNITAKDIINVSTLSTLLSAVRAKAGTRPALLVLDNFEQIQDNDKIIKQIASIIVLLDDPVIAQSNIKILVVGVPGDIKSLIARSTNASTLQNRLTEISEVERLTLAQSKELMKRGFEDKLQLQIDGTTDKFYEKLCWNTDRIAQQIHELCLSIARSAIDDEASHINDAAIDQGLKDWMRESLASDYAVVEQQLNSRETKVGRKNQILYALGQCETADFRNRDIDTIVRQEFPKTATEVGLNVAGIMSGFSKAKNPLIRKARKEDAYRFVSPKYRMAIRTMLSRAENEKVIRAVTL